MGAVLAAQVGLPPECWFEKFNLCRAHESLGLGGWRCRASAEVLDQNMTERFCWYLFLWFKGERAVRLAYQFSGRLLLR